MIKVDSCERLTSLRIFRVGEEPAIDEETARLTPEERVEMIAELTLSAYAIKGETVVPGIRRDVVRIVSFDETWMTRTRVNVVGLKMPMTVLGREALIKNKRAVGRLQRSR